MTKKSKPISVQPASGLIANPTQYYSEKEKREIIEEYLATEITKVDIWKKYTGQTSEHGVIIRWMRQLGYTDKTTRSNATYSTELKHKIIQDYLLSKKSKQDIWEKYTGQTSEHGKIIKWMRELGYDNKMQRNITFVENISSMSNSKHNKETADNQTNKALQDKINRLEKELEEAKIKAITFSTMIDIAEQELNIPIRKKRNTKPLKK